MATGGVALALQVFGTLFLILISFLGMTAWIVRRIDTLQVVVMDMRDRMGQLEGKVEAHQTSGKH